MKASTSSSRLKIEAMIGVGRRRHHAPCPLRECGRDIDRQITVSSPLRAVAVWRRCTYRRSTKVERVGIDDEIGQTEDQDGEARDLEVGDGHADPSDQQRAHPERSEHGPSCALNRHAFATARRAIAPSALRQARLQFRKHFSVVRNADAVPPMTGKELRIHTSERTLDGRVLRGPRVVASIASNSRSISRITHSRQDRSQNLARLVPLNAGSPPRAAV